jgi:hypothetical protein
MYISALYTVYRVDKQPLVNIPKQLHSVPDASTADTFDPHKISTDKDYPKNNI